MSITFVYTHIYPYNSSTVMAITNRYIAQAASFLGINEFDRMLFGKQSFLAL